MYGHVLGEALEASVRAGILHAANDRRNAAQWVPYTILLNAVRFMPFVAAVNRTSCKGCSGYVVTSFFLHVSE